MVSKNYCILRLGLFGSVHIVSLLRDVLLGVGRFVVCESLLFEIMVVCPHFDLALLLVFGGLA